MSGKPTRAPNAWAVLLVLLGGAAAAVGASGVDLSALRHPPLGHLAALVAGGTAALFGLANLFRRMKPPRGPGDTGNSSR